MAAPHAAPAKLQPRMVHHSELGYRLLPRNNFAISNYMSYLHQCSTPSKQILTLGAEAIASDPEDPAPYTRMVAICIERKDYAEALSLAQRAPRGWSRP